MNNDKATYCPKCDKCTSYIATENKFGKGLKSAIKLAERGARSATRIMDESVNNGGEVNHLKRLKSDTNSRNFSNSIDDSISNIIYKCVECNESIFFNANDRFDYLVQKNDYFISSNKKGGAIIAGIVTTLILTLLTLPLVKMKLITQDSIVPYIGISAIIMALLSLVLPQSLPLKPRMVYSFIMANGFKFITFYTGATIMSSLSAFLLPEWGVIATLLGSYGLVTYIIYKTNQNHLSEIRYILKGNGKSK